MVKRMVKRAGIENEFYPHLLRNTAETLFYQAKDYNIRKTQEFLGHISITSTQIYNCISPKELEDEMDDFEV